MLNIIGTNVNVFNPICCSIKGPVGVGDFFLELFGELLAVGLELPLRLDLDLLGLALPVQSICGVLGVCAVALIRTAV